MRATSFSVFLQSNLLTQSVRPPYPINLIAVSLAPA